MRQSINLTQNRFWVLNESLFKELGLMKSFVLADLISKHNYCYDKHQFYEDNWFFYRREDMLENLGILPDMQRKILNELRDLEYIDIEKKGPVPQKNYYRINQTKIQKVINDYEQSKRNNT